MGGRRLPDPRPWESLERLIHAATPDAVDAYLQELEPAETARAILRLSPGDQVALFALLSSRVADVVENLRAHAPTYSDYDVQYAYVVSDGGVLSGVLRLRDLLFARPEQCVVDVMPGDPLHLPADASLQQLDQFFEEHAFLGVPVTDEGGRLIGVVQRTAVQAAVEEHAGRTFLAFAGIGQEEVRTMPLMARSTGRLSWLSINVFLNILAASVIAIYQDTLAHAIVLAVFLPIISDMSGCSGNQAVAVSIRELRIGLVKPHELLHVLGKEIGLGVINGVALGLLLGGAAFLWKENPYLGLVVGGALTLNTIVAVALGGLLPLILRGLKFDPALASGPILTTFTDMCGFFILLRMASAVLPHLAA
jgi:magnesium transporter